MKSMPSRRHTFLFRFVSTLVFTLVILSTVAADQPDPTNSVTSVLNQVYTLFFGSTPVNLPADTTRPMMTRDTSCIWDPSCNPPPPQQ